MNFAQITVSGNIGADPEIRDVNGTKVANFSVAVNESYNNKSGEKVEKTHWYRCEAWDGGSTFRLGSKGQSDGGNAPAGGKVDDTDIPF